MAGYTCAECSLKLWLPICGLRRSHLGLYDDARFPGRAILVFHGHEEHLHELTEEDRCAFMEDAAMAAQAIMVATGSPRMNYAVLGNTQRHLHWHLIPRRPDAEPLPDRPPWEDSRKAVPLDADTVAVLIGRIEEALVKR